MSITAELEKKAAEMRGTLAQIDKLTSKAKKEKWDGLAHQNEKRAASRDLRIPEPKEPHRREDCEADDELWLRTYCEEVFYNPFVEYQKRIIADAGEALRYGTQKCKAAPRGGGKSSIVKYLALKYSLCRQVRFPLVVAATGTKARGSLDDVKRRIASGGIMDARSNAFVPRTNLGEDYPLECGIASYVNPWPSRARNVTANGRRSINVEWNANQIILPTWEDTEPLGPILMALGVTSDDLQGCNVYDIRPDFIMLDDLDSRDSLAADEGVVAGKIEEAIDKTIAGMGGQSRGLGKFYICTITSRNAAAYKYSDPALKQWAGERVAAITKWPDRTDLWERYTDLRKWGTTTLEKNRPIDPFGRKANQFYVENFEAMNAGAEVSNPFDFKQTILKDGSQQQLSGLQRCYDYISDNSLASFLTEHQNDPPEETGVVDSGIKPLMVKKQLSGFPRGVIPPGCTVLAHGCDVGKTKGCHWVVRAFKPDGTGFTIDYGIEDVIGAKYGSDEGLERAIHRTILQRMAEFRAAQYATADGEMIGESLSLFDARWQQDAVVRGAKDCGLGVKAMIGIGKSGGCVSGTFKELVHNTADMRKCGTSGAFEKIHVGDYGKAWVVHVDADRWKGFEHERWMTAQDRPGCMFVFGEDKSGEHGVLSADEHVHDQYAAHICGEIEAEVMVKGFPVRKWIANGGACDWFHASYISDVAAAMQGIRIIGTATATRNNRPVMSLAQMAKAAGR